MTEPKKFPLRETIFGLEDGTVSTLGVLVGIAAGTENKSLVILSGLVIIFVESLSMAAGTFLSNKSELQYDQSRNIFRPLRHIFVNSSPKPIRASLFMFVAYVIGGLVALSSFFFLVSTTAIITAVLLSFVFLFVIGFVKGRLAKINPLRSGLEMMTISASAAITGFVVGKTASFLLPGLKV